MPIIRSARGLPTEITWEKKPKEPDIKFCEPGEAHAGMREVLMWALMLCVTHRGKVEELNKWAKAVVTEKDAAETAMLTSDVRTR